MPVHNVITDGRALADKMVLHGNCYLGQDRNYYIEYGGGRVTREAIDAALADGLIELRWPDKPELQYWKVK
jgi:hypothetical protein